MIHRFWSGPPHPMYEWIRRTVATQHPHAVIHEWGVEDLADDDLISGDVRHTANVLRYQVLLEHGGLWLDHDVVPLTDLTKLETPGPWVAGIAGRAEGSAMFFPEKGHPALEVLLERARWPEAGSLSTPIRSGSYLLNEVLRHWSIRLEPGVLPFDAVGQRQPVEPLAVHLWDTTRERYLPKTLGEPADR